jgi:hypothetical protein
MHVAPTGRAAARTTERRGYRARRELLALENECLRAAGGSLGRVGRLLRVPLAFGRRRRGTTCSTGTDRTVEQQVEPLLALVPQRAPRGRAVSLWACGCFATCLGGCSVRICLTVRIFEAMVGSVGCGGGTRSRADQGALAGGRSAVDGDAKLTEHQRRGAGAKDRLVRTLLGPRRDMHRRV